MIFVTCYLVLTTDLKCTKKKHQTVKSVIKLE